MTNATGHEQEATAAGDPKLPRWQSNCIARSERLAFLEEITAGNLRRMRWFILIYLPVTLSIFLYNHLATGAGEIDLWSLVDAILGFSFLALTFVAQRRDVTLPWKRGLVLGYYIYCLVVMTGYYFIAYSSYGETQSYTLGVLMVAILFRLPPREFLGLLITNQLAFSVLFITLVQDANRLFGSMIAGLDAFLLGCLAAHFLFSKEWQDFQKGRLLAKRNLEMVEANAELQKRNEEMKELMAITAHDLRSPLVNVHGLFELLQMQAEWQGEPYRRVLTECGRACGETLDLITRLLDAHFAEQGGEAPCFQYVGLQAVLEEVVKRFLPKAQTRSIGIEILPCANQLFVETDPTVLQRALENLISNAVKFSPSGSSVLITLSATPEACRITISDEGPGIPVEERHQLFTKFRKGATPAADATPGTGLGLFIVRRVMENVGGTVLFEPRLPHGAHFHLTLPQRSHTIID